MVEVEKIVIGIGEDKKLELTREEVIELHNELKAFLEQGTHYYNYYNSYPSQNFQPIQYHFDTAPSYTTPNTGVTFTTTNNG